MESGSRDGQDCRVHDTEKQRRSYEEACLAAVRRRASDVSGILWNRRRVTGIELRGVYPDTEIVIAFTDDGRRGNEAYDIWREDPPGDLSDPRDVDLTADLIFINVSGM
jgi:hypothetical protein